MKVAFDTSVIVAALVESHPRHDRAGWWFHRRRKLERIASWHAYTEAWSMLTALPIEPRISGALARSVLERLRSLVRFVPPKAAIYASATERCVARGLRSGAVFDALHLRTAEVEKADLLLTFNEKDFVRLADAPAPRIVAPPDPPGLP